MLRRLGADFGFAPIVIGACAVAVRGDAAGLGIEPPGRRRRLLVPVAEHPGAAAVRRERRVPGVRARPLVDGAERRRGFTATCCTSCSTCSGCGSSAPATVEVFGPARTVIIYTIAGVGRVRASSFARRIAGDARRVGGDLRPARRAGALRPAQREPPHLLGGDAVRGDPASCSASSCAASTTSRTRAASRAATSRRRCEAVVARARRPPHHRGPLPGRDRPLDRLLAPHRPRPARVNPPAEAASCQPFRPVTFTPPPSVHSTVFQGSCGGFSSHA